MKLVRTLIAKFLPLIKFTLCSGGGLSIDFVSYYFLTQHFHVLPSNIASSFLSVTFIYFTTSKLVHYSAYSFASYLKFMLYYTTSIIVFSCIISVVHAYLIPVPVLAKLATVPFSLLTNYFFSSKIVAQK